MTQSREKGREYERRYRANMSEEVKERRRERERRLRLAARGGVVSGKQRQTDAALRGERFCARCQTFKPFSQFSQNKNAPTGAGSYCRICFRDYQNEWNKEHPEVRRRYKENLTDEVRALRRLSWRRWYLATNYGVSIEEVDALLKKQDGGCAICGKTESLHIDHDHLTSRIRGLLCGRCNRGLGMFMDDPEFLRRAADYLA